MEWTARARYVVSRKGGLVVRRDRVWDSTEVLVRTRCVFFGPESVSTMLKSSRDAMRTFALQISNVTLVPAQLRTSVAKRFGSGSSCSQLVSSVARINDIIRTIGCPLIPTMKSNQGSRGSSGSLLRRTWKPNALSVGVRGCWTGSVSSPPMNLFSTPNMASLYLLSAERENG